MNLDSLLDSAIAAAHTGGALLKKRLGKIEEVKEKSSAGDLVTEADKGSEARILAILKEASPNFPIVCEESGYHTAENGDYLWAVDPLDGTTNYTHQLPAFAISIALIEKGTPVIGVIYNPITEELFAASASSSSTLNGMPIAVSTTSALTDSLLATGFAYDRRETPDNNYAEFCALTNQTQGVRRMGSAALDLAYVACGRFDGFWERGLNIWDIAAGVILVRQAGGVVTSYENGPLDLHSGRILATNSAIHHPLSDALKSVANEGRPILRFD